MPLLILLAALSAALFTYLWLERIGLRAWAAIACRTVAWAALGLLLVNLTCALPGRSISRPLVLLDGSLSLAAAGGRWREAFDSARVWGEVRRFGDETSVGDSVPSAGRSLLAPALVAAAAAEREVIVVSDGEIEDATDLPAAALRRVGVRLFPRPEVRDLALSRITGPDRVTAGDSVTLDVEVRSAGGGAADSAVVQVALGARVLARRKIVVGSSGTAPATLVFSSAGLPAGDAVLRTEIVQAKDAEPRDDARLWLLRITATPGVVVIASPTDWDARFLYRTIRDVAQLPVRGYARLEAGRWRAMETLAPVPEDQVAQAARKADLLVLKGAAPALLRGTRARGVWLWPSGEGGETIIPGDWYVTVPVSSPVAGAFAGLPADSFPPMVQITPIEPTPTDWVGLVAQEGRRGAEHPILTGRIAKGTRRVTMAADGLYRWAFRGGSSEQGYRALVAATVSWLLGAADSTAGKARPVRAVVQNGRPVVFGWTGNGAAGPVAARFTSGDSTHSDTLRFDGAGRALVRLPVGQYRYRLEGGGEGTVIVEEYSDEWLHRPVVLSDHPASKLDVAASTNARRWLWLFALGLAGLAGEWWTRRVLGLR